ncbi:MAG: shikimate kinase [Eggerthellaceae bacterium]|nr:shikimate kinase [Eggerthellaceae bacterium]
MNDDADCTTQDAAAPSQAGETQVFDFRKKEAPVRASYRLVCPVFFVGFMGAGKTSVARKLARNAGVAAIDMDTYIERREGKKVTAIFDAVGEEGFRAIETAVLQELAAGEPVLVSCGGGVVLRPENRQILKDSAGFVVYLKVTAAEAASRISDVSTRPLFGDLEQAERVIEGRLALYEEVADACVDTAGHGSGAIAREVMRLLKKEGILEMRPPVDEEA